MKALGNILLKLNFKLHVSQYLRDSDTKSVKFKA